MWLRILFFLLPLAAWACGPPTQLTIYRELGPSDSVVLRWSASDCAHYHVWASPALDGPYSLLAEITAATFTTGIQARKQYFYVSGAENDSLESLTSDTVGYVRITVPWLCYTAFGLPFRFWDVPSGGSPTYGVNTTDPEDILGDQLNCAAIWNAERVIRQDGSQAWRQLNLACAWRGPLQINHEMEVGRAYWLWPYRPDDFDFVLAGQVDNSGDFDTLQVLSGASAYTPLSWRTARSIERDHLNLIQAGFRGGTPGTSDQVMLQGGGAFCWLRLSDNTWQGNLNTVEPGRAYWILNRPHGNTAWNYIYNASGNP